MPYAPTSAFLTMALGLEKEHCTSTATCSCAVASARALWLFRTSTTSVLITSLCTDLSLTLTKAAKNTATVYSISWMSLIFIRPLCQGPPSPLWIFWRYVLMLFGNNSLKIVLLCCLAKAPLVKGKSTGLSRITWKAAKPIMSVFTPMKLFCMSPEKKKIQDWKPWP